MSVDLDTLLAGCADESFDDGIRIDTELEPLAGAGRTREASGLRRGDLSA